MVSPADDPVREAWRRAAGEVQQRQSVEQTRDAPHAQRNAAVSDRDTQTQSTRRDIDPQRAKQFEWQQAQYEGRQNAAAAKKELDAKRDEHTRINDPNEFARQEKDKAKRAEWGLGDRNAERTENQWDRSMSDRARGQVDQAQSRDTDDRDRSRSDR
jgi:hypothetical protein